VPDLRKLARGRECQIRLENICSGDPTTVVLAHLRMPGLSGMGIKSPDLLAAYACSSCHDACDRRSHMELAHVYVRLAFFEGMARTQALLIKEGVLKW
jgi:hypothetical protein